MSGETIGGQPFHSRIAAVLMGEAINKAGVIAAFIWLARTLDPATYGIVEWALSLSMVFTLVSDAGLSTWAAARIAARPADAGLLVAQVGWLRLAIAVPAYLAILAISWFSGGAARAILPVYGLVLFLNPFFLQYLFNGLFRSGWAALGNGARGTTFAAAVFLFARHESDGIQVALAEVAGASALALCSLLVLWGIFRLRIPVRAGLRGSLALLRHSWAIGATDITSGVHWYAGLILLGYLAAPTDAAWHSAGLRITMALHTGVWLYLYVLLPNLSRLLKADTEAWQHLVERSLRLTAWVGLGIGLVFTVGARPILMTVFGNTFEAAAPALRATIWVVAVSWMSGHVRYSLIAAERPDRDYRAALVGVSVTIAGTLALAPAYQSLGAGMALLGGTVANGIAARLYGYRILPSMSIRRNVAGSVAACGVALFLGLLASPLVGDAVAAVLAGGLFFGLGLVAERETVREGRQLLAQTWRVRRRADVSPGTSDS